MYTLVQKERIILIRELETKTPNAFLGILSSRNFSDIHSFKY